MFEASFVRTLKTFSLNDNPQDAYTPNNALEETKCLLAATLH